MRRCEPCAWLAQCMRCDSSAGMLSWRPSVQTAGRQACLGLVDKQIDHPFAARVATLQLDVTRALFAQQVFVDQELNLRSGVLGMPCSVLVRAASKFNEAPTQRAN